MSLEPLTLVWAPIKGYPMWPSQIVDPAVCNNDKVLRAGKEGQLLVYYFGDHMFGWYPRETHGLKDFAEHYDYYSVPKSGKTKLFQAALDEAEAEKKDLGATSKRWQQSLTDEQIRSRKLAGANAEAAKPTPSNKKEVKPKPVALPKESKAVRRAPEPDRTGFDVFRSNIGYSLDINELHVYQEMWDAMTADRKQYYEDLARSGEKKDASKKGSKAAAPTAAPRKPPGAFQLYVTANKNLIRELGLTQKEFKVYLQGEWESAPANVRAPFEREAMEKMNVYQSKRTEWILANPDAGAALSDKDDEVVADSFSVGEVDHPADDDPRNHDYCEQCGRGGELICCDGCPASYHPKCLPVPRTLADLPDHWFCHICSASRGVAVDQKLSAADTKKKGDSGPAVSPVLQRPDSKRERHLDDPVSAKKMKSERDSYVSSDEKGRVHDGDTSFSRQSSESGSRKKDDSKSGWGPRLSDRAGANDRDARVPETSNIRTSESSRHPPDSRLFISGVNCGMTERDLALEIKKYGKIAEQFRFKPGAAFVHVQMATSEDAHRALVGLKNFRFQGREPPLNVKIADPRPGPSGSDRLRDEPAPVSGSGPSSSDRLVPGMSKSEVESVLRRLGFDRNSACLEDVRRLRDELNDLTRTFDQKSSDLTIMRSNAASKIECEKNDAIRDQPRLEEAIRSHYRDLLRKVDIEAEELKEQDRSSHRTALTNWKRRRQNILGSHRVPCFIDQGLPPRDMWTTIDHAWAYLDRCAPASELRREPPRLPISEPHRHYPPPGGPQPPSTIPMPNQNFNQPSIPIHHVERPSVDWSNTAPLHPHFGASQPLPPNHMGYPPTHPAPGYPPNSRPGPLPSIPLHNVGFERPPPTQTVQHRPEVYMHPSLMPPTAPHFAGMDFGSDDILAAFSAVEELASMAPAASTPPCNIDMYNSDLMISALKKS
jgi:hypothetical protein